MFPTSKETINSESCPCKAAVSLIPAAFLSWASAAHPENNLALLEHASPLLLACLSWSSVQQSHMLGRGGSQTVSCLGFPVHYGVQEGQMPIQTQTQPMGSFGDVAWTPPHASFTSNWTKLTFMVTVMVLLTFALCSQPCFITPPFWEHREEESWKTANSGKKRRSGKLFPTGNSPWTKGFAHPGNQYHFNYSNTVRCRMYV